MFEHFEEEKAKKKALTAKEKKEIKQARDEMEAKYLYCMLDGRKEKIGNFRIEPPGLFRGRGQHPKKGALKVDIRLLQCLNLLNLAPFTSIVFDQKTSSSTLGKESQFRYLTCLGNGKRSSTIRL